MALVQLAGVAGTGLGPGDGTGTGAATAQQAQPKEAGRRRLVDAVAAPAGRWLLELAGFVVPGS